MNPAETLEALLIATIATEPPWMQDKAREAVARFRAAVETHGIDALDAARRIDIAYRVDMRSARHAQKWTGFPLGRPQRVSAKDIGEAARMIRHGYNACEPDKYNTLLILVRRAA